MCIMSVDRYAFYPQQVAREKVRPRNNTNAQHFEYQITSSFRVAAKRVGNRQKNAVSSCYSFGMAVLAGKRSSLRESKRFVVQISY